jgi:hypothetical protein
MKELEVIVGEYRNIWRFESWLLYFPHSNYNPINNGRIHLFCKIYFRLCKKQDY